jgi:hypothetical protein
MAGSSAAWIVVRQNEAGRSSHFGKGVRVKNTPFGRYLFLKKNCKIREKYYS